MDRSCCVSLSTVLDELASSTCISPAYLEVAGLFDGKGDDDVVRHSPALLDEHIADSASKASDERQPDRVDLSIINDARL